MQKTNTLSVSTVQFSLRPYHITKIETERTKMNKSKNSKYQNDAIYGNHFWEKLGKEFECDPFAMAIHYFAYLIDKG